MKKRIVLIITVILAITLCACSSPLDKYADKISELRTGVYEGSNELYDATAVTGVREDPFLIDGKSGKTIKFTVVTVRPKVFDPTAKYTFKATIDGKEYNGPLNKHPFEESYSADIGCKTAASALTFTVVGDSESTLVLNTVVGENFIGAEKAFELGHAKLKNAVQNLSEYELYIRLIKNPLGDDGNYYWYVAFVTGDNTYAVLINAVTTEIVASRE